MRAQVSSGAGGVSPEGEWLASVGSQREQPNVGFDQLETVAAQLQLVDQRPLEPPGGEYDLGDAADSLAALEHDHPVAGARKPDRAHESVVPAAGDDRVVATHRFTRARPLRLDLSS